MPLLRRDRIAPVRRARRRVRRLFLLGGAVAGVAAWRNREVSRNESQPSPPPPSAS